MLYERALTYEAGWHRTAQNKNTIGTDTTFAVGIDLFLTSFPCERAFNLENREREREREKNRVR